MFVTFYNLSHYHIKFQIVQPTAVRFDQVTFFATWSRNFELFENSDVIRLCGWHNLGKLGVFFSSAYYFPDLP